MSLLFLTYNILNNDKSDSDINFFNNKNDVADSPYFHLEEIPCTVEFLENSFSVFHINIRSLNKNFEKLLNF